MLFDYFRAPCVAGACSGARKAWMLPGAELPLLPPLFADRPQVTSTRPTSPTAGTCEHLQCSELLTKLSLRLKQSKPWQGQIWLLHSVSKSQCQCWRLSRLEELR